MAASLIFTDYNNSFRVEYKTDLLPNNDTFTVCEVVGLSDLEVSLGMSFKQLPYTVEAMKSFALSKGLKLEKLTNEGVETLQDFEGSLYYSGGLGIDNL